MMNTGVRLLVNMGFPKSSRVLKLLNHQVDKEVLSLRGTVVSAEKRWEIQSQRYVVIYSVIGVFDFLDYLYDDLLMQRSLSCITQEIFTNLWCPVCQHPILVRLQPRNYMWCRIPLYKRDTSPWYCQLEETFFEFERRMSVTFYLTPRCLYIHDQTALDWSWTYRPNYLKFRQVKTTEFSRVFSVKKGNYVFDFYLLHNSQTTTTTTTKRR